MRVAFLGLGRMGAPMAVNVADGGHDLVVWNRTHATAEGVANRSGATVAATPREATADAQVVITMLADEDALRRVCAGPDGLLAGLPGGAVVIDMGTTGPAGIGRLAPLVADAGGVLVDAPVSGSTTAAEAASLTILVGASLKAFALVESVLQAMGDRLYRLGEVGAGSVAKLAVNNIVFALGNALAESLVLAERAGLDRTQIYEVFEHSAVAAPLVGYRHDAFLDPEHTPAAFAMTLAHKDLRLITDLASTVGLRVEQAEANRSLIGRAVEAGLGEHDMADVAVYLRGT